ncbi:MAG: hypothetical protein HQM13_22340 [SAR324 cluster bacterium]|nr:hypothetical protein [SAR324 cluster bacterium]
MAAPAKKPAAKAAAGKNSKKNGEKSKEAPTFDFNFEARAKPITEKMLALEAKRQKGFFSKKTKFPITDIIVLLDKKAPQKELNPPLMECLLFYKKNEKEGFEFLEALGRLVLEAASKERLNGNYQTYLLYLAIDIFSSAIQHSEKCVNQSAEGMLASAFKILSPIAPSAYYVEKEILKSMGELTKEPNDLDIRDKIIKLCMKGKRYYEAFYQILEYEQIMQLKSRSMYMMKGGEIQFRKATAFQHMIDFYLGVASGEQQKNMIMDSGKLRSFITRFNMDNPRSKLLPLAGPGPLAINKTLASLIDVANVFYAGAANNARFAHRHKAYYCMAHNNNTTDKVKSATNNIISGLEVLAKSNLKAVDKGNEKIQLLEFIIKLYNDNGSPRKAEEYVEQLNVLRNNVRQMESKKRAEDEKRKEALKG